MNHVGLAGLMVSLHRRELPELFLNSALGHFEATAARHTLYLRILNFLFLVSEFCWSRALHIWKTCCITASCLRSSRPFNRKKKYNRVVIILVYQSNMTANNGCSLILGLFTQKQTELKQATLRIRRKQNTETKTKLPHYLSGGRSMPVVEKVFNLCILANNLM